MVQKDRTKNLREIVSGAVTEQDENLKFGRAGLRTQCQVIQERCQSILRSEAGNEGPQVWKQDVLRTKT